MALPGFLLAAGAGAALWAGLALGVVKDATRQVVTSPFLTATAARALIVVLVVVAMWLCWWLWQKYRFRRFCAVPHITPDELLEALAGESRPLVLDLRGALMIAETGPIAGATVAEHDRLADAVGDWPKDRPIVTLCACPEDAGAVQAARQLLKDGYRRCGRCRAIRGLAGGNAGDTPQ